MALRGSAEERQAKAAEKERQRAEQEEVRALAEAGRQRAAQQAAFDASPPGLARRAKQSGQRYFQFSMPLEDVDRTWMAKFSHEMDTRVQDTSDAVGATLTAIEEEGWELVNSGFTFRETAQASRDKFLATGQQIATIGQTIGFYLFRATNGQTSPESPAAALNHSERPVRETTAPAVPYWECTHCGARMDDRPAALLHADEAHLDLPIEQARAVLREVFPSQDRT